MSLGNKPIGTDVRRLRPFMNQSLPAGTTDHGGLLGLSDDDHTQYASANGSGSRSAYQAERLNKSAAAGAGLTGGGTLTADISFAVGAGYGISVTADDVAIKLKTTSGLEVDTNGLALDDAIAGAGLAITSKVLRVGGGNGIDVSADGVAVSLATNGGLSFTEADLQIDNSIAGNGLTISATKVLDVGAGNGIAVSSDAVSVLLASPSGLSFGGAYLQVDDALAGAGLTITNKVLAVGAGYLISVAADTVSLANGTAQYQIPVTGPADSYIPTYTLLSAFAGDGLDFISGKFEVGDGTLITATTHAINVANGSAQYQVISTGATPFTPAYTLLSTFAGDGLDWSSGAFIVGAGALITTSANAVSIANGTAQYQVISTAATPFAPSYVALSDFAGDGIGFSTGKFNVGAGYLITTTSDAVSVANGDAQYQIPVTGATPFAPAYTLLSTFAGDGLDWGSGAFIVGAGTLISTSANAVNVANGTAQYQIISTGATPFAPAYTLLSSFAGDGITWNTNKFFAAAGTMITVGGTGISLSSGTAQYQIPVTAASPYTPSWTLLSTFAGNGLTFSSGFNVGAGTLITVGADNVGLSDGTAQYQIPVTGATTFTPAYALLSTFAGDGLTFGTAFNIGAGNGIAVASDSVAVNLQAVSGLTVDGTGLALADTIAGAGIGITSKVLSIGAGTGISVATDGVAVDTTYAFTWTGAHTFQNNMVTRQIRPELTDTYDLGTSVYYWRSSYISQINATIFAEMTATLLGGWFKITKGQGVFAAAVASGDTTIDFGQAMTPGNFVEVRAHDTGGTIKAEYIQVGTLVSGTVYNVTRDMASAHVTDPAWAMGTVYEINGTTGDGRIELNAYDTPRIQVVTQGANYNDVTEMVRIGDLNGWGPFSGADYGWAVGNYSGNEFAYYGTGTGLVVRGTIRADDGYLASLTVSGTLDVGTGGVIKSGATAYNTGTGWWLEYNGGTPRLFLGSAAGDKLLWSGTALTITGDITADGGSIGGWTINTTYLAKDTGTDNTSVGLAPSDYPFYAGATYTNRAAAPFRVTPAGAMTATSGVVGGWTIASTYLVKDTGTDATSSGMACGDYPFYAGATYANRAAAPFRVSPAGALTATSASITGAIDANSGTIGALTVDGTLGVGTGGAIKSGATAYNTGTGFWFEYNAGTPRFYIGSSTSKLTWDGTTLSVTGAIDANSGYLGTLAVDGTITMGTGGVLKTSGVTDIDTGTGVWITYGGGTPEFRVGNPAGSMISWNGTTLSVVGTIDANAGYLGTLTVDGTITMNTGGVLKTSGVTNRNTGTGLWISYNAGTPEFRIGNPAGSQMEWDGTTLSVVGTIDANAGYLGTLTVDGTLSLGTGGVIKSGATAYNTGTGFWIDYNAGTPRFFIGNAAGSKLTWDGTTVTVTGTINADAGYLDTLTVSGTLSVSTGGVIKSGATAYNAGTGWWLDYNAGTPRFYIGSSTSKLTWDGTTLSVTGAIDANSGHIGALDIDGVLTIATTGEIRQGTGTLGADFTGLRVWRDTNVGRIAGYNDDILQWYAGTDGKLYAGAGSVILSSAGIALDAPLAYYTAGKSVNFTLSGSTIGYLTSYYNAGSYESTVLLYSDGLTYNYSNLRLTAKSATGYRSVVYLTAQYISTTVDFYLQNEATVKKAYLTGATELNLASADIRTGGDIYACYTDATNDSYFRLTPVNTNQASIIWQSDATAYLNINAYPVDNGASATYGAYIRLFRQTQTTGITGLQIMYGDGSASINHQLSGQGADSYVCLVNGNFGIGDSTPSYKLDVAGTFRVTGAAKFDGDVDTVPWTDYSATSTITGWTSYTTKMLKYKKLGNVMYVQYQIAGVSNSTSTSFTLPSAYASDTTMNNYARTKNDGTWSSGVAQITSTGYTVSFYINPSGSGWTNTGDKEIRGEFFYIVG